VKVGDLVKTTCFGPHGRVGEIGLVVEKFPRIINCWWVLFNGGKHVIAEEALVLLAR
jgi:hypothetical protein